jgi:hypothetical protein
MESSSFGHLEDVGAERPHQKTAVNEVIRLASEIQSRQGPAFAFGKGPTKRVVALWGAGFFFKW